MTMKLCRIYDVQTALIKLIKVDLPVALSFKIFSAVKELEPHAQFFVMEYKKACEIEDEEARQLKIEELLETDVHVMCIQDGDLLVTIPKTADVKVSAYDIEALSGVVGFEL